MGARFRRGDPPNVELLAADAELMMMLLVAVVAATLIAPPMGTFCIDGDCRRLDRPPARVKATAAPRTYVWTDADQKNVFMGTIGANETRLPSTSTTPRHDLALRLSDPREAAVTLELIAPERTWTVSIRVESTSKLTLIHPPSACTLRARARSIAPRPPR